MNYLQLAYLHLATMVPAFIIGTYLMLSRKGTPNHKMLGKWYMSLMVISATVTLFMPAEVGPRFQEHFGYIHLLTLTVYICVPLALRAAKSGNTRSHIGNMLGLYIGGLLVAGSFALMPGRMLNTWLFS